jgi:hypothetical protein
MFPQPTNKHTHTDIYEKMKLSLMPALRSRHVGSGGMTPYFLNLSTRQSYTFQFLHRKRQWTIG